MLECVKVVTVVGDIPNSLSGIFALGGGTTRTPGRYYAVSPDGRQTSTPLRDTYEYVHPSVRSRFLLGGPGVDDKGNYPASALRDWKLVIKPGTSDRDGPEVYWKLRDGDRKVSTRWVRSLS